MSAGQRCTAARRLIVEDGQHEELVDTIVKLIDRLIVDHPHASPAPFMGPVIDNEAADQLQDAFLDLTGKGGRAIRRLDRKSDDRPFLTPALIDVTEVERRPDEEMFGPVLQVIRVADFDAALAEANATRYGLAASLVGGSPELYDRFWANVRAGVDQLEQADQRRPLDRPVRRHRPLAATTARAPITPPIIAPIRSPAPKPRAPRATIGVGLADPGGGQSAENLEG